MNPDSKVLEVRKYPNRRFYDVTRSRHVTLADLYEWVRTGNEIRVTDSKTGTDITQVVLTQIILEHDPPKLDLFPSSLLHQTLQANQQVVRRFIDEYFARAMDAFVQSRSTFEGFLEKTGWKSLAPPSPLDWMRNLFPGAAPSSANSSQPPVRDDAIDELRQQVKTLSEQLTNLAPPRRSATKKKKRPRR